MHNQIKKGGFQLLMFIAKQKFQTIDPIDKNIKLYE